MRLALAAREDAAHDGRRLVELAALRVASGAEERKEEVAEPRLLSAGCDQPEAFDRADQLDLLVGELEIGPRRRRAGSPARPRLSSDRKD